MSKDLPDGFEWPETLGEVTDEDALLPLQTSDHDGWTSPGVYPETYPESQASHFNQKPELETFPLVLPSKQIKKQFSMQNPKDEGGSWSVEIHPGWVYSVAPRNAHVGANPRDPIAKVMPELNGTPLNEKTGAPEAFPRLAVAIGDRVTLRIERDKKGAIVEPVVVMVRDPAADSDHYHPEIISDDVGEAGEYMFWDIFDVEDNGNGGIKAGDLWQDDIFLTPFLWTGENMGVGEQLVKEFAETEDIYKFRTLLEQWGIDLRLSGGGNEIEVEFKAINVGGGSRVLKTKAEVAGAADPNEVQYRTLTQGPSGRQEIVVDQVGDNVRVYGNGKNGFLSVNGELIASWVDGLWRQNGTVDIELESLPSGSAGDILYHNGTEWVVLNKPVGPTAVSGARWILAFNGGADQPEWVDSSTVVCA